KQSYIPIKITLTKPLIFIIFLLSCQNSKTKPIVTPTPVAIEKPYYYSKDIIEIRKLLNQYYGYPNELNRINALIRAARYATQSLGNYIFLTKSFYTQYKEFIQGENIVSYEVNTFVIIKNPNFSHPKLETDEIIEQMEDDFSRISFNQSDLEVTLEILSSEKQKIENKNHLEFPYGELLFAAAKGYVSAFDDTSLLENEEENKNLRLPKKILVDLNLKETKSNRKFISSLSEGSEEYKIGLRVGDELISVNSIPVRFLSMYSIENLLSGAEGLTIQVITKRNKKNLHNFSIPLKQRLPNKDVEGSLKLGKQNIIYIKINAFIKYEDVYTSERIEQTFNDLIETANNKNIKIHGLLLDLRNNQGGYLEEVQKTLDMFLGFGPMYYTQSLNWKYPKSEEYAKPSTITNLPIAILINASTFSGAELFAGSMQYHNRGIVLGTRSSGNGIIHMLLGTNLPRKPHMKIPKAFIYLPNGYKIHQGGIDPDIWLQNAKPETDNRNGKNEDSENITLPDKYERIKPKIEFDLNLIRQWVQKHGTSQNRLNQDKANEKDSDPYLHDAIDHFYGYLIFQNTNDKKSK
ncbi:S41 family peptidase, partial [Leptospira kanakyensis]|uniref:S41 family peptidase n=1 Tax=Leptospira kanakyensis TaxID=2484968 RepID=UPI00223E7BA9